MTTKLGAFEYGYNKGKQEALADEIKWLEETFKDIRNARTEVSGLSWLQFKVNDRIEKLKEKVK